MTSLLAAAGLRNAGAALTGRGGTATLEAVLALQPDLLLLTAEPNADDQGSALLSHPALRGLFPPAKRLIVPEILTACGGPMLAEALDRLGTEIAAHR
jgi:iron complex transport system substrate-binding protein